MKMFSGGPLGLRLGSLGAVKLPGRFLGFARGSWEGSWVPLGFPEDPWGSLGGPGGSLGVPGAPLGGLEASLEVHVSATDHSVLYTKEIIVFVYDLPEGYKSHQVKPGN